MLWQVKQGKAMLLWMLMCGLLEGRCFVDLCVDVDVWTVGRCVSGGCMCACMAVDVERGVEKRVV